MTRPAALLLTLTALPLSSLAAAEDLLSLSLEQLTRLEVQIATGTPTALASTPAATTLITDTDFQALASRTVDEALVGVPGLHVSPHSGPSSTTRYYFRGMGAGLNNQSLTMINGIPITAVGITNLPMEGGLPLALVKRIEVIRGPGSAVHGTDAFAGVINIITKDAGDMPGNQVGASYGSFDTHTAFGAHSGHVAGAEALLLLSHNGTRGDNGIIPVDTQSLYDASAGTRLSQAPGPVNQGLQRLDAYGSLKWAQVDAHVYLRDLHDFGLTTGANGVLDPDGRLNLQRFGGDVAWHAEDARGWSLQTLLSYWHTRIRTPEDLQLFPPGAFGNQPDGTPKFPEGIRERLALTEDSARASVTALYQGRTGHRLRLGAGWNLNDLRKVVSVVNYVNTPSGPAPRPGGMTDISDTPEAGLPEEGRESRFAFAQDEWRFHPGWELTTGLRYDHFSDVSEVITPRLALVWQATPALTGKLIYGEAFRAPSLVDATLATGTLDPERLRSVELGLGYRPTPNWTWELTTYEFRMSDIIDFASSGPVLGLQNTGRSRGRGVEGELGYQRSGFRLRASASVQQNRNAGSGADLGLAPRHQLYLRASQDLNAGWQLNGQVYRIGPRARAPGDPQPALPGYTSVDVNLRRMLRPGLELFLTGRNLLDANIREPGVTPVPSYIPLPGRSVSVGTEVAW